MRSDKLKKDTETLPHRALLLSAGLTAEDLVPGKPFIGVANSYNNIIPGHIHLNDLNYLHHKTKDAQLARFKVSYELFDSYEAKTAIDTNSIFLTDTQNFGVADFLLAFHTHFRQQ